MKKKKNINVFYFIFAGMAVAMIIVASQYQSHINILNSDITTLKNENQSLHERLYLTQNKSSKKNSADRNTSTEKQINDVSMTSKVNDLLNKFVSIMYANQDSNLLHRYEKMKPMLSGEALQQLKPASATPNTDNGQNAAKVSDVKTYISPADDEHIDVLTEYTLTSKVGDNDINSPMVLKVTVLNTNGAYSIDDFKTNSSFASNLSDRK